MKNTFIHFIASFLLLACAVFTAHAQQTTVLSGGEAIEQLKQNGQYDSLKQAFRAARGTSDETETPPLDAAGQSAKLTASDGAANDLFGTSVAVSGDTAIIGAYSDAVGANSLQGSAYVFVRSGTTWTEQAKLVASDGALGDQFGISVSISGDAAAIGAIGDDVNANTDQGSVYVFTRLGSAWTQQQKLTGTSGAAGDTVGSSVSISGDKIAVGAPLSDASASTPFAPGENNELAPTATNQGSVFFFVNAPAAPTAASVSISGRVLISKGRGLQNAVVYLTCADGSTFKARTSAFGSYRFDDVAAGETVLISVNSKRYRFAARVVNVTEDLIDLNFFADLEPFSVFAESKQGTSRKSVKQSSMTLPFMTSMKPAEN